VQKLDDSWVIDLKDGVSAYRTDDGELRIDQSVQATRGQGAETLARRQPLGPGAAHVVVPDVHGVLHVLRHAVRRAAERGAIGGAMGAEDATDFKRQYGISDEFVDQVGKLIHPGESAGRSRSHRSIRSRRGEIRDTAGPFCERICPSRKRCAQRNLRGGFQCLDVADDSGARAGCDRGVRNVREKKERQMGAADAAQVDCIAPRPRQRRRGYINTLGRSMASHTSRADLDWRFAVVNSPR
jgi:hypothetical protein